LRVVDAGDRAAAFEQRALRTAGEQNIADELGKVDVVGADRE
jgi:hypothetical protein